MKTLMLYGTKTNVTKDIAKKIVSDLDSAVTLHNLKRKLPHTIADYDVIIIGSPIYMGYMMKSVRKFVHKHLACLLEKRVALFIVGADRHLDMQKYLPMSLPKDFVNHVFLTQHLGGEFRIEKTRAFKKIIAKAVLEETTRSQSETVAIDQEAMTQFIQNINQEIKGDDCA